MKIMKKRVAVLLSIMVLSTALSYAKTKQIWKNIKVEVKANHPVETTQSLQLQTNGFQLLKITLSNKGKLPLTIEKIAVNIPLEGQLAENLDMVYGGSCMGRTPMLKQKISSPTKQSWSHMYEMLRLSDGQYVFAGSTSWRIFLPNFTQKKDAFEVWSDGEGKQLKPGQTIQYEQIVLKSSTNWLELLEQFGTAIAAENNITKLKPADYKGWATWDYYGRVFTPKDIYGNMDQLNKLAPEANMIQIDGGWWTERGDYKTLRPDLLPGGLKEIVSRITAEGKTPGVHFDGFRGDEASEVYKAHPEYFLHDQDGKLIVEENEKSDKVMHYIYFDYSHPGARAHIADCIKNMKDNWGIRYFKVDFMRYGLENDLKLRNKNVKSIKAYDPTITGVERFRLGMKTMREAMGDDTYFLGCSAVFGPCIGFVDGMRTGGDIHPSYKAFPERCLANLSNFYLSGKVFNGDADYLVFREAIDEDATVSKEEVKNGGSMTFNEAQMWADFNKLYGTARLHSDNLMTIRPERKALVKEVFEFPAMEETVPLDFWKHGTDKLDGFELLLARKDKDIYLGVFNWGDQPKDYAVQAFGIANPIYLEGRHSQIVKYEGKKSFDELCENLKSL
ncbi:glycoside hydrolase family 36 protein [Flavobacterium luteum]|uniref:Alpha-galactosidase n=1 Tax=Flavobacterium luteum TaxID=2026654 RepID=A0A7J5A8Y6_9FLAO|nr:glycoside hydrolase family 36 protein [Flavobacterium luteum]KAB1154032.1 alpha-galactosidase [Flavobacterium luteum]